MCLGGNTFVLQILASPDWISARVLLSADIFQPSPFAGALKGNSDVQIRLLVKRGRASLAGMQPCTAHTKYYCEAIGAWQGGTPQPV